MTTKSSNRARSLIAACLIACLGACADKRLPPDVTAAFPTVLRWQGSRLTPVAFSLPCPAAVAGNTAQKEIVTAAGVGLRIPIDAQEIALEENPGENYKDHRMWQWTKPQFGAGTQLYHAYYATDVRKEMSVDTLTSAADSLLACGGRPSGYPMHLVSYTLPPGNLELGPASVVDAWIAIKGNRMVWLHWWGESYARDEALTAALRADPGLPPSDADFPHTAIRVPPDVLPDSVPLGDSAAFYTRYYMRHPFEENDSSYLSVAAYRTRRVDFLRLERRDADTLIEVATLLLPGKEGASHVIATSGFPEEGCTLDGKPDVEIIGYFEGEYPDRPTQPTLAWRASLDRAQFELVDPKRVSCTPEEEVD